MKNSKRLPSPILSLRRTRRVSFVSQDIWEQAADIHGKEMKLG